MSRRQDDSGSLPRTALAAISPHRVRRVMVGLFACAGALLAVAGTAVADVDTAVPGGLGVVTAQTNSPALTGSVAQPDSFTYAIRSCDTPFIAVQSGPSGYVIGNCTEGTHFYPQDTSTVDTFLYYGGYVFGDYGGCGWITGSTSATQTAGGAMCPAGSIGYNLNEFALATNASAASAPGNDCDVNAQGNCTDGSMTSMVKSCTYWANFKPWLQGQEPTDPILNPMPAGTSIKWRYVAKYPSSSGISYVMVRVAGSPGIPDGYGNWGFVNVNCTAGRPYYTPVS